MDFSRIVTSHGFWHSASLNEVCILTAHQSEFVLCN